MCSILETKTISKFVINILEDIENGKFNDMFNEIIINNDYKNESENNVGS